MFNVDTDIPVPGHIHMCDRRNVRRNKYPFARMGVGDSFIVPDFKKERARIAAIRYRERHEGWRFIVQRVGVMGWRLWRIA